MSTDVGRYYWDVFVSYRRDPMTMPWIKRVVDTIAYWLRQELGGDEASVFFDIREIAVGAQWPNELRHAIRSSKCLLPILSPDYFRSEWCLAEWSSFIARQGLLPDRRSVIVPITLHDGQWFPDEARSMQQLNLCEHASTVASYWETTHATVLDRLLRDFAMRLAKVILDAPEYRNDWPVLEPAPPPPPRYVPMRRM